jgi:hypothetical protein
LNTTGKGLNANNFYENKSFVDKTFKFLSSAVLVIYSVLFLNSRAAKADSNAEQQNEEGQPAENEVIFGSCWFL